MLVNKESIQPTLLIVLHLAASKNKSVLFQKLLQWRHLSYTVICYSATCRASLLPWCKVKTNLCPQLVTEHSHTPRCVQQPFQWFLLSEVQGGRMSWLMSPLPEWNPDNFITFPVEEAHFPWVILRYPKLRKWALCHLNCLSCAAQKSLSLSQCKWKT